MIYLGCKFNSKIKLYHNILLQNIKFPSKGINDVTNVLKDFDVKMLSNSKLDFK